MKRLRTPIVWVLGNAFLYLVVMTLTAPVAWPQASTGTVSGTARDQTGAVVPKAQVSLANTATNVTAKTTTNDVGFYMFPGVVPGPYLLSVEAPGMEKFEGTLTVQVGQSTVVNVALRVGTTRTEVEVRDVTPLVTVDNPTLGHVLERTRIEQLPINGRQLTSLLGTVPGLEGWHDGASGGMPRAYGSRLGAFEMMVDGTPYTERNVGYVLRRQPGLDTVQEFKVETNSSSAKFTRPYTAVVMTRSGANAFHGSVFETHRNNGIGKARRRQDYYEKPPPLIRNEWGASAGGPAVKDKTFWFFAYEGRHELKSSTKIHRVPTEAMRKGDFRGLVDSQGRQYDIYDPWSTNPVTWERQQYSHNGQLNVIDPALLNPLGEYLFGITPLPTDPEENPLVGGNWVGPRTPRRKDWTVTARVDHNFSENDRFYARYTQGDFTFQDWACGTCLAMLDGSIVNWKKSVAPNKSLALSWTRAFSPAFFNEVLVSGSRQADMLSTGDPETRYANELGLPNPFSAPGWPKLDARKALSGYMFWSINTRGIPYFYLLLDDNATKIKGRHEFQFGYHYRYDQLNFLPDQQQAQGRHNWNTLGTALYDPKSSRTNPLALPRTGHSLANMFLGSMNYLNQFQRGYYYIRSREYALYFQDNFKVSPRLTLNLGLRWEYWPAFTEKNGTLTSFDLERRAIVLGQDLDTLYRLGATLPSIVNRFESLGAKFITYKEAGLPRNMMESSKRSFGPRLGFAYRMGDGARSIIMRGGYRISYFHLPGRQWVARMALNNSPMKASFQNSLTSAALSPDGIRNYGMRSVPTIIAGVNSQDAVPIGDASSLTRGSASAMFFAKSWPDPRVHDWNFTLEKEVMPNTVARVSYVGNHGEHLDHRYLYNQSTPDYIWYVTTGERRPTGEYANVARRPYDQQVYGNVEEYRMTAWSNYNGIEFELERRYNRGVGFQVFYTMSNALAANSPISESGPAGIPELNQFLPGKVPTDVHERVRFLMYRRDSSFPKHRVRWNWIVDLPFGKGKPFGRNASGVLDKVIGGWQLAGMGSLRSNYFSLPTSEYPTTGNPVELYGYKYPIEDCRSGVCRPGYLWWNGYIPAHQINSTDPVTGKPNGIMGVPSNYKPAAEPLWPWPAAPNKSDPMYKYYGTNTVWVPLNDGSVQRIAYNDNLHPWRQQYFPGVRQWNLDASLFKRIPITERVSLRFNADFFNVLNNPGNPNSIGSNGVLSTRSSGQDSRELQLTLRLTW